MLTSCNSGTLRSWKLQKEISELLNVRSGLPGLARKLENGEPVKIGFIGGSITLAEGYRVNVISLLQEKYPSSRITGINGGIGGTGSVLGVFRLYNDILRHQPDIVWVEFAVNDSDDVQPYQCMAAMEGIIRQIRLHNPAIDICFLYTINQKLKKALENGELFWSVAGMEKLAGRYGIPSINLGPEVLAQEKSGRLIYRVPPNSEAEHAARQAGKLVFSYDSVHPTLDDGHGLYSKIIMTALDRILFSPSESPCSIPSATLSASRWASARMMPLDAAALSKNWIKTTPLVENLSKIESIQRLPVLWKTNEPGAEIRFRFKGSGFGLFGLFGLNSGQFKVWIDGAEHPNVSLFDKYGNRYRVHYVIIADSLPDIEHAVVLQLDSEPPDRGMLLPGRPVDDPAKLKGLVAYLGNLLILGDLH